jgi:CelD/BcsL family acetyltransferase involved in cellulose biosynthesis
MMTRDAVRAASVVSVDPQTSPLWGALVEQVPSDVFHSPAWMRVLADTYNLTPEALIVTDETGRPSGGMSYIRVSDVLGERIASLPFSDYCDPLLFTPQEWELVSRKLMQDGVPIATRCLHNGVPLGDESFPQVNRAKWHGIDLQADLEVHWQRVDGSARRAIRKAEKEGVSVRLAEGEEDLRAFFGMHLGVRKHKYRMLAQPYRFFQNIWRHLVEPGSGFVMLAIHGGQIIGGVMFLEWKETLYYKFNASHPDYLNFRPNDMVIWNGIQLAKAKGYRRFDFGLSDWDQDDLIRYKMKYATEEKTISFLRHQPAAASEKSAELRKLFNQLTDLLTDESVPDDITSRAGDVLYRFFV